MSALPYNAQGTEACEQVTELRTLRNRLRDHAQFLRTVRDRLSGANNRAIGPVPENEKSQNVRPVASGNLGEINECLSEMETLCAALDAETSRIERII